MNAPNAIAPNVSSNYAQAETEDNPALLSAMNSCPAGQAVELVAGPLGQSAFVFSQINAVNSSGAGIYVLGDAGLAGFQSLNTSKWGTKCGTMSTSGTTSCGSTSSSVWLGETGTNGGYIGYMNWYGRGWDTFSPGSNAAVGTQSFYEQRGITYYVAHGGVAEGSPTCPGSLCTPAYQKAYGVNGFNFVGANSVTVYKPTLRDGSEFLTQLDGVNGATFWDTHLIAPFWMSNTDGFDPLDSQNVTFTYGSIESGDNCTALKASDSVTQYVTVSDSMIGPCIGLALGTSLTHNINQVLFANNVKNGDTARTNDTAIEITSAGSGNVNLVSYNGLCFENTNRAFQFITSGTTQLTNLYLGNITGIGSNLGSYNIQGTSTNKIGAQLDNVNVSGTPSGSSQDANLYFGPGMVTAALKTQLGCGSNGVTCTGTTSASTAYPCAGASWNPLSQELNIQTPTQNNAQTYSGAGPITLQAVVQPITEISSKESTMPTGGVQFYDNGSPLGSPVALSGDGFYAAYTIVSIPAGTHNYTAAYCGVGSGCASSDSNYPGTRFGSAVATNGSGPSTVIQVIVGGHIVWQGLAGPQ